MKLIDDMHAGHWVNGFHPEAWRIMQGCEDLCFRLNATLPSATTERAALVEQIFGRIGEGFTVHSPFRCDFGKHIFAGRNLVANYNLTILDEGIVTIGNNVFIGPNVSIYTINHALLPEQRNVGVMRALPVDIADDVWIGGGTTILPGVSIGRGAVIGAGSVVTRSIPAMTIAAGNPCRIIRAITPDDIVDRIAE